jgi:hypothetical protein
MMRIGRGVLFLCVVIPLGQLHAYDHKYAAEFLNIGVGARAMAMGGAFCAVADDATSSYWNPSGLRLLRSREIGVMHSAQFANEVKYDYLVFGSPSETESFGASIIRMGIDDIPYTENAFYDWGIDNIAPGEPGDSSDDDYDPLENPGGTEGNGQWDPYDETHPELPGEGIDETKIELKSDVEMALILSYAKDLKPGFMVGANAKLVRQGIGDSNLLGLSGDDSMFGFGFDVGMLYQIKPWWRAGACLHDAFGTLLIWNNGTRNVKTPTLKLGNAFTSTVMNGNVRALAAVDFDIRFEGRETASQFSSGAVSIDIRAGGEISYREAVALRVGMEPSSQDKEPYGRAWNLTLGAGLAFRGLNLDYAFSEHPSLDETHRVSLGLSI